MMEKEEEQEEVEEIMIHWFACKGTKLTESEMEDLEDFFDNVLNNENYFEDSDDWVMVILLCENCFLDSIKDCFKTN